MVDQPAAPGDDQDRAVEEVEIGGARHAVRQVVGRDEQPLAGGTAARAVGDGAEPGLFRQVGDLDSERAADA